MKFNKKLLSIFLTVLMLVSTLGNSVFAVTQDLETNIESGKTPLEGRVEGDKKVFTLDLSKLTKKAESKNTKAMPARVPRREPVQYDTTVNITATGLNGKIFDWDALPNKEFKLIARYKTTDGQSHTKVLGPFTDADTKYLNIGWPVDNTMVGTADIEADFNQKIDVRVLGEYQTSTGGAGKLVFDIELTELAEPRAEVKYVDPYGRAITDPDDLPTGTMPKVTAPELTNVEIDLPNSSKEINMRNHKKSDEDELNEAENGLTFKVDNKTTGETVTIDGKDYKLDISAPNAKQVGTIKMIYQKDVVIPPTKPNSNDPVDQAQGYFRLTFDANENKTGGITGKHTAGAYQGQQKSYIDVKQGVKYENANLQAAIKALSTTGTKLVGTKTKEYTQDAKNPWTPKVPDDTTPVAEKTYYAQYVKSAAEQVTELGGLKPVTIKVWKGDIFNWSDGVAPKTTDANELKVVKQLLDEATVTDKTQPERTSAKVGKEKGTLLVTFRDSSTLEVQDQWLYVSEHIVTVDPNSTDPDAPKEEDLPDDKIEVKFLASTGVKEIKTTGKTFVKPGTTFKDTDFPQEKDITFKEGYKGPVTWTPANKVVTAQNNEFTATASKKKISEMIGDGEIVAKDFGVFVGTDVNADKFWKKGVQLSKAQQDNLKIDDATASEEQKKAKAKAKALEKYLNEAKSFTDLDGRTTTAEVLNPNPGKIKITFSDDSTIEVANQKLYVYANGSDKPTDPNQPIPEDAYTVTFERDETSIAETNFKNLKPIIVQKDAQGKAKVEKSKFPVATVISADYENPTWKDGNTEIATENGQPKADVEFTLTGEEKEKTFKASATEKNADPTADKDKYDPIYQNGTGKPGDTVTIPAPKFKDDKGNIEDKKPVDNKTNPAKETTFAKNDTTQTNVTVDPNTGAISVDIPTTAKVGDIIKVPVDVIYPDKSRETVDVIITVIDQENPTIDQPYEGDNKITGKGEPGSDIVVELPGGTKVPGKVDKDGNWTVDVPADKPLKPGDKIVAKQTKNGKVKTAEATVMSRQYYLTLTLDENYRGGRISDYDVYVDELIERYLYTPHRRGYVFEGWSYNSRRLDEVRPGDRINYSTTLYAIWSKQKPKDDEDVEPVDTREVGEHKAYMFGYTDGTVRPNGYITRAEAAALVTRLLGLDTFASAAEPAFTDTPSSWYNKAINAAVQRGIMKGYPDKSFRPNAPITRAEFTQMISTIDNKPYGVAPFADVVGHWAERPIGSEYQAGRIKGYPDGTFRPNAFITRAEAVVILNKIFERNYDAMSAMNAKNKEYIKRFIDLAPSFWGFNDMVEATNTHLFKRRVKGSVQEDWVEVK